MGRYFISILICSLVTLCELASAYPAPVDFDGSILRWNISSGDDPITYEIKATHEEDFLNFEGVIDESASIWNSVPNSYFRFGKADVGVAGQVTINLERAIDGGAVSSGYAIFDEYQGKKPSHCSIYILIEDSLSETSTAKTILHELGHCLGLGHSLIPESIMSYQLDKNQFGLDIDDEAAISRLYPIDGSKPELPPGCAVAVNRPETTTAGLILFLFPMIVFIKLRLNFSSVGNR